MVAGTRGILVDERSRGTGLGGRVMRLSVTATRSNGDERGNRGRLWLSWLSKGKSCPFMSRRGGRRSTLRNVACLVQTRRPSSCLRAVRTSSAPPNVIRASGRKVTSIFRAPPGDGAVPQSVPLAGGRLLRLVRPGVSKRTQCRTTQSPVERHHAITERRHEMLNSSSVQLVGADSAPSPPVPSRIVVAIF